MLKVSFQWKNSDKICLCSHWAAGIILPPFLRLQGRVAAVAAKVGSGNEQKKTNFWGSLAEHSHEKSCKVVRIVLVFSSTMKYI